LKLKLSDWASLAEVVSAIAVVISILYLGYQIRENTNEVRASSRQQLISRAHSSVFALATNPELSEIVTKVSEGSSLTPTELTQYGYLVRGVIYDVQEAYLLYLEGRLDEDYWTTRANIVLAYLDPEPARNVYLRDRSLGAYEPAFEEWMDQALQMKYGE
jgi:hypothetical protein